jgi:putative oxidoreductase
VFRKEWWFDSTRAHHSSELLGPGEALVVTQPNNCDDPRGFKVELCEPCEDPFLGERTVFDWANLRPIWEPRMLSILRIMTGLLFLEHGLGKIFNVPAAADHRPYVLFTLVPGLAGLLELIGGALFAVGLFTRPVAFILAGEMAFAYFMAHAPNSFFPLLNRGDAAILYCFIFLYFFFVGAGVWSLDRVWADRNSAGAGTATRA